MRPLLFLLLSLLFSSCEEFSSAEKPSVAETVPAPAPAPAAAAPVPGTADTLAAQEEQHKAKCSEDDFFGRSRAACKTSIVKAKTEQFPTLEAFIASLPGEERMREMNISESEDSKRVKEEERNVRIGKCWLLAVKFEDDGDFHLIVGNRPSVSAEHLFNVEISGLPDQSAPSYAALKQARAQFESHFDNKTCFHSYRKFYDAPIPIAVAGSLFYDSEHESPNRSVGPKGLKPKTAWEIHPVTGIEFLE